ncbi:hypothetical protein Tco_0963912, partial [Tanacetum coccineum]
MESPNRTKINAGIQQHLQKAYNTNKAAFKAQHWVIDPTTGTYDVEKIRRARPEDITAKEWKKDPEAEEYPSLIDTFFVAHTVNGEFLQDEDRRKYEMLRLQALGSNTETGVSYTEEEIMAIVRKGKQRGHLPGVGRVLSGGATDGCSPPPQSTVDLA